MRASTPSGAVSASTRATLEGNGVLDGTAKVSSIDIRAVERPSSRRRTSSTRGATRDHLRPPSCTGSTATASRARASSRSRAFRSRSRSPAVAPARDRPFGRERIGLRLVRRRPHRYGLNWNAPNQGGGNYLGDDVKLIAELALVRQEG